MPAAPLPSDEAERLALLHALSLLDTPSEPLFDRVTRLASQLLEVPIALFSLVDAERQWFKSRAGLDVAETPREHAFCAHAICQGPPMVVKDATEDERFRSNPLVTGAPNIRFYAGVPIRTSAGLAIGTLCAIDTRPRELSEQDQAVLSDLAAIITEEIRYRERLAVARAQLERTGAVLGASEARFRSVFDAAVVGIALVLPDGTWVSVNPALCQILGYGEQELLGIRFPEVTYPPDRAEDAELIRRLHAGEIERFTRQKRYVRKDGSLVWVQVDVSRKLGPDGEHEYNVAVVKDIDAQKRAEEELAELNAGLERRVEERTRELQEAIGRQRQAEQELRAREVQLRTVIENANDAYISLDRHGLVTAWNRQAEETFGWSAEEALGTTLECLIIPPELAGAHQAGMRRYLKTGVASVVDRRLELPAMRRDGSRLMIELRIRALDIDGEPLFSAFLHDITERKEAEARREYESRHDALTGLPNRRALMEALPVVQSRAGRSGRTMGLLFVDLDGFKAVNDEFGHDAGDALLRILADRLRAAVRKTDSVFRLAGDEFTVLLEDLGDTWGDAHRVGAKLIASIAQPAALWSTQVQVGASIGIALCPPGAGLSPDALIREADQRMYEAKRAGRGCIRPELPASGSA
ncbi:sensor domain-containing diguanylate cyclase [Massilia sp. DD77]|uniref:sensor domain-containing diguanylate cyclase n=1 Tax=Massilia sp. DD77 TaxID=3109349 RepID=UPI0030008A49